MSGVLPVTLVGCGLIGTTAEDHGIMERAFSEACATQGIVPGTADYAHCMVGVDQSRGQPPVEVFRSLFPGGEGRAEAAAMSFERSFRTAVDRTGLSPMSGAEEAIREMRNLGVRVCVVTGLSRQLLGAVLDALDWWRLVDLALCPDDAPRGFPWPDLMFTAMLRLGVEDVTETAFAGSTASGVLCGSRSGAAVVAGVLAGGHTADRLRKSGATHLINGIGELPRLLVGKAAARKRSAAAEGDRERGSSGSRPVPRVPLEGRGAGL